MSVTEIAGSTLSIGIVVFAIWMLLHCIVYEEDPIERVSWALVIGICGFIGAPIYFFRCYLPRRKAWNKAKREGLQKSEENRQL